MPDKNGNLLVAERKELREVIDTDFRIARNELENYVRLLKEQRRQEVTKKYADSFSSIERKLKGFQTRFKRLIEEAEEIAKELTEDGWVDSAGKKQYSILVKSLSASDVLMDWKPQSMFDEIKEANQEIEQIADNIRHELAQKHNFIKREIAISAVKDSPVAMEIIENAPSVKELLIQQGVKSIPKLKA